jgi:MFS family permease
VAETEPHRAWIAVAVISLAALICTADRTLPTLLMEPVKQSLSLSDSQIGLLTGFTFAVSISIASLPLAWLADRYDRALILSVATAVWCLMTVASGFATDFISLFVLRLGVGLGEAALIPAAFSLLGDLFPAKHLPMASAAVMSCLMLGGVVAMWGGGEIYQGLRAASVAGQLSFSANDAWRWTTVIFGAAGLVVAALAAILLPEPRGKSALRVPHRGGSSPNLIAYIRQVAFFLWPYILCGSAYNLFYSGFSVWLAPFFSRTYGWTIPEVGRAVGLANLIGGLVGPAMGAGLSRLVRAIRQRDAPVTALTVILALSLPFAVLSPLAPNGPLATVGIGVTMALAAGSGVIIPPILLSVAPPPVRARVFAVVMLLIGLGSSPGSTLYAAFTDDVLRNPARLYVTLSLLSGVLVAFSIAAGITADRRYRKAVNIAQTAS